MRSKRVGTLSKTEASRASVRCRAACITQAAQSTFKLTLLQHSERATSHATSFVAAAVSSTKHLWPC